MENWQLYLLKTKSFLDYRHSASKHLNTTAIPTLNTIPDVEKIYSVQTSTSEVISPTSNTSPNGSHNLNSTPHKKTQNYSNCVIMSPSSEPNSVISNKLHENDISIENVFHPDHGIIIEDGLVDGILLEGTILSDDIHKCDVLSEYLNPEDLDEKFDMIVVDENEPDCEDPAKMFRSDPTNYVELIETNDYDVECMELLSKPEDPNEILFKEYSRADLVEELVQARNRIKELEKKLQNIQQVHLSTIQTLSHCNKTLIS